LQYSGIDRRVARRFALGAAALALLALLTFALPIREWRTGELAAPPLPTVEGGPAVTLPARIWIDTDAACGLGRTTDPDDCFAILLLAKARGMEVVGISTVHGNAPQPRTDSVTRQLVAVLGRQGIPAPPVFRGSAEPMGEAGAIAPAPAHAALASALEDGPLTLVATGPLTNLAAALKDRPHLRANVGRLVAVMGRRPGHLFHPAEGEGKGGILFGHGPVFRDFNFEHDREAATLVLGMKLPTTLVPYDAARQFVLTAADVARLERRGGAEAWVAERARDWLDYWNEDIGLPGFYPFDLLAGAYMLAPERFDCAEAEAWISRDRRLWGLLWGPWAVLVTPKGSGMAEARAHGPVVYCERIDLKLQAWLGTSLSH
jgi:inosine-uridine nucleoside N-ribohydrolase